MRNHSVENLDLEKYKSKVGFGIKIWLEFQDNDSANILGSGWAKLLESIKSEKTDDLKSLTQAAKECGYSYKYAWNILKRIEKRTGISPVETARGGPGGGGWIKLNEWGDFLLTTFNTLRSELEAIEINLKKSLKIR
ncbi:MAG: ModE family transcriptional regulator [Promethearchaeota archaeon]|nr:MAG: ModE family transcriptional regulator [Candidatus Lokiarchaeota archaeon]